MTQPTPSVTQDHWVYLCYDAADRLLYVGITSCGFQRFKRGHSRTAPWWADVARIDIEHLPTREVALEREVALIVDREPIHNVVNSLTPAYVLPRGLGPSHWMTLEGIADWLDTEQTWVLLKVKQGMPHARLAGEMRFRAEEVRSWLRRGPRNGPL